MHHRIHVKPHLHTPQIFDIYLRGRYLDTVYYPHKPRVGAADVKRGLVYHDGYGLGIAVVRRPGC